MAGLTFSPQMRGQLAAIAKVRWQLFVNSLRTMRGRLEMASRIFVALGFVMGGFGGAIGLGAISWFALSRGQSEWIAIPFWIVFLMWQLFPVVASAFTENVDSSNLLRFPLSFPTYFLIRIAYGSLDPSTALGVLWLLGIAIAAGFAAPNIAFVMVLVCVAFAVVNILLARMIFAWVERWLARRRTREILAVVFFLFIVGIQFIGPIAGHFQHDKYPGFVHTSAQFLPIERMLPPGLAAASVAQATAGHSSISLGALAALCAYGLAILALLNLRLRSQFHGENLSEGVARSASPKQKAAVEAGWGVRGLSGAVSAILEKEFHYLSRSGPVLFTLVMPVVIILIFRFTPVTSGHGENFLLNAPDMAFPAGAAYTLLVLTNLVYNTLGSDAAGSQFFYVSPVRFRDVLLAKNLAHSIALALDTFLAWLVVDFMFRPPALDITSATIAGMLFAVPISLAAGNLLSLYSPKKYDTATLGRQRAPQMTVLASFGIHAGIFGVAALVILVARHYGHLWIATLIFLALAVLSFTGYWLVLNRVDKIALDRRETILTELCKA